MTNQTHCQQLLETISAGDQSAKSELERIFHAEVKQRIMQADHAGAMRQSIDIARDIREALLPDEIAWKQHILFFQLLSPVLRRRLLAYDATSSMPGDEQFTSYLMLEQRLEELLEIDEQKARIFEYTYIVGMSYEELADLFAIPVATVDKELRFAKAWICQELG